MNFLMAEKAFKVWGFCWVFFFCFVLWVFFSSQNSCFKRGLALKDNYKNDKLASVFGCLLNNFSSYLLMTPAPGPKAHLPQCSGQHAEHRQLRLCQKQRSHALPRVVQKLKTLAVPLKCTCIVANSTEGA